MLSYDTAMKYGEDNLEVLFPKQKVKTRNLVFGKN